MELLFNLASYVDILFIKVLQPKLKIVSKLLLRYFI